MFSFDSINTPASSENDASEFDDLDRKLIELLREDGRMSTIEIARRLNVTEPTARRRLKRLLTDGGVRVRALLDPRRTTPFGATVMVLMQVELKHLDLICRALTEFPEPAAVSVTGGKYNIMFTALFPSREAIVNFMSDKIGALPGIIAYDVIDTLRVVKIGQAWVPN